MAGCKSFDVAIVGGGPVGLSLAAGLVHFMPELSVAVLDRKEFKVPDDARSLALAAGVTRLFEGLGLWAEMEKQSTPISHMRITDSATGDLARPLFLSFDGEVTPGQAFAHMVPFRQIVATLLKATKDKITLLAPISVSALQTDGASGKLTLADGTLIQAPLIVAADGSRSTLRQMAGIKTIVHDYHQSGLVTTISHGLDHDQTAFEHFRPAGPFASLPLPNKRSSLVWTETGVEAERLKGLAEHEQARIIEASMGRCLGAVRLEEPVQSFPLRLCLARSFVAPRLALIGDAAHSVHPITGQGLNLGLKDVAALIEVIIEAVRRGEDHGDLNVLTRYERWRRLDVALMALVTDSLNRLFSNEVAALRIARDFGLGVVDRVPPLKQALIRQAAGMGARGPKLLLGQEL